MREVPARSADTGLRREAPVSAVPGSEPAPRVRITVSGGHRPLPAGLPGDPVTAPASASARGSVGVDGPALTVLTVDARHSDALLAALLADSWHIHHLGSEGVRV